jgi:hypothetical protein
MDASSANVEALLTGPYLAMFELLEEIRVVLEGIFHPPLVVFKNVTEFGILSTMGGKGGGLAEHL